MNRDDNEFLTEIRDYRAGHAEGMRDARENYTPSDSRNPHINSTVWGATSREHHWQEGYYDGYKREEAKSE